MDTNQTLLPPNHLIQAYHTCLKVNSKLAKTKCDKLDANFPQSSHEEAPGWWKQGGFKQEFMKVPASKDGLNVSHTVTLTGRRSCRGEAGTPQKLQKQQQGGPVGDKEFTG